MGGTSGTARNASDWMVESSRSGWAQAYELRDREEVVGFVEEHPELKGMLAEAQTRIPEHFGNDTAMALEVATDIDSENAKELLLLIPVELSVDDAMARMSRLDEDWWLDGSVRAKGLMNVDIEYI